MSSRSRGVNSWSLAGSAMTILANATVQTVAETLLQILSDTLHRLRDLPKSTRCGPLSEGEQYREFCPHCRVCLRKKVEGLIDRKGE